MNLIIQKNLKKKNEGYDNQDGANKVLKLLKDKGNYDNEDDDGE